MDKLVRKVYDHIRYTEILADGEHIVAGVSGGADSICLLFVLHRLAPLMHWRLSVVHVNHGLRGEAADADQHYVEQICMTQNIECYVFKEDIAKLAAVEHLSEEEAGRMYRYQCFEKVREQIGADKIAVAHHLDDLEETVLMNLFRGTGIKGLAGIPAVRGNIVRPLLQISRKEIEMFLADNQIQFRTDATNFETDYTRNRIRLELLPYIRQNINSSADMHIAETAMLAADAARYIERQAAFAGEELLCRDESGILIPIEGFDELDVAIQRELLRQVIGEVAGQLKDIGLVHIEAARELFARQTGKEICLPYAVCVRRMYGNVKFFRQIKEISSIEQQHTCWPVSSHILYEPYVWKEKGQKIQLSVQTVDKNSEIPKNRYTKWFDYDKIKHEIVFRYRREGDYMMLGSDKKKLLRRIFMDDKIPKHMRDSMVLLAEDSHILWIPFTGRISEYYKVTEDTTRLLSAQLKESKDERED